MSTYHIPVSEKAADQTQSLSLTHTWNHPTFVNGERLEVEDIRDFTVGRYLIFAVGTVT